MAAPWALVRPNPPLALAYRLGPVYGEPEFVAMDVQGRNVCGVTSEKYDIWIVKDMLGDAQSFTLIPKWLNVTPDG